MTQTPVDTSPERGPGSDMLSLEQTLTEELDQLHVQYQHVLELVNATDTTASSSSTGDAGVQQLAATMSSLIEQMELKGQQIHAIKAVQHDAVSGPAPQGRGPGDGPYSAMTTKRGRRASSAPIGASTLSDMPQAIT